MKLSIAIADQGALPTAFVVWRGIEASIRKAADLGFDGVELALKHPGEVDRAELAGWLKAAGLEVSCISTGQVFAGLGLMMTDPDPKTREELRGLFRGFIDLAAEFGGMVNLGRVRGRIGEDPRPEAEGRFIAMARELCDYAAPKGVSLILEPVNRYEIDFINAVEEGVELMKKIGCANMKLMPDVFHMNIEDKTIGPELAAHIDHVGYVHMADSNRLAPGWGHTDFGDIFNHLAGAGFDGWVSVEILPKPTPDAAARQSAEFLKPYIQKINQSKKEKQ